MSAFSTVLLVALALAVVTFADPLLPIFPPSVEFVNSKMNATVDDFSGVGSLQYLPTADGFVLHALAKGSAQLEMYLSLDEVRLHNVTKYDI